MMYTIEQLREVIKAELDKQEYVEEPYSLFEPIKYIMEDGGKRLRPVLTLMAYNLYRDDIGKALKSAIGIEIFHNYTLLHDDVMDDAELRRGRQTVHKKWNSNVAILSGDAAAITAYKYIETCEDPYLRRVIDGFNQVAMDVCKGHGIRNPGRCNGRRIYPDDLPEDFCIDCRKYASRCFDCRRS